MRAATTSRHVLLAAACSALACNGILGIPSGSTVEVAGVTIDGTVSPIDNVTAQPKPNVRIRLTSVPAGEAPIVTSDASGAYALADLGINTALELEMSFDQTNPTIPSGVLVTRFLGGNAAVDRTLDLPVVDFHWLAKVAFECNLFPSLMAATFDTSGTTLNPYYISRSTIVGEVLNEDGTPASLNRSEIKVTIDGYENSNETPTDTTFPPRAHICFLEPDADGIYKGVDADSTSSGRFVMFRARDTGGTGAGFVRVLIPGFPPGAVNLRSSGSVGFVRIHKGEGEEPLPDLPRTFEDVYPLFKNLGCVACHTPGGVGYEMAPVRAGFRADFSGTIDEVFKVLTDPPSTGCENGGDMAARVCVAKPEASLLFTKPRLETGMEPSDHKGIAFPEDSNAIQLILKWLRDGAKRN